MGKKRKSKPPSRSQGARRRSCPKKLQEQLRKLHERNREIQAAKREIKANELATPVEMPSSSSRRKSDLFETRLYKHAHFSNGEPTASVKEVTASYLFQNEKRRKVNNVANEATENQVQPRQCLDTLTSRQVPEQLKGSKILPTERGPEMPENLAKANLVLKRKKECTLSSGTKNQHSQENYNGMRNSKEALTSVKNDFLSSQRKNCNVDLNGSTSNCLNLDNENSPFFCLLCSNVTSRTWVNKIDNLGADFLAMFILKKMLNVPTENLVQFLATSRHPHEWITVCPPCSPIISEAFQAQQKICELELILRRCQREMKKIIAKTFEKNHSKLINQSVDELSTFNTTTTAGLVHPNVITITKDTRHYVSKGAWPTWNPTTSIDDDASGQVPSSSSAQELQEEPEMDAKPYQTPNDSYSDDNGDGGGENTIEGDPDPLIRNDLGDGDNETTPAENVGTKFSKRPSTCKKYKQGNVRKDPVYSCAMCPLLKPLQIHSFVKHLVFHNEKPYKCKECNAYFTGSELELKKRAEEKQDSNGHVCTKSTLVKVKLKTEKIWECGHCSSTFELSSERESHENMVHSEEKPIKLRWDCSKCPNKFRDYHEWRVHRALSHVEDLGKLGCFYCDKIFKLETIEDAEIENPDERVKHIKEEHGITHKYLHLLDCRICGMNFYNGIKLKGHMEKEHGTLPNCIVSCQICFRTFRQRYALKKHLHYVHQLHSQPEKLVCDVCGYETCATLKGKLLEHKFLKHGIEPDDGRHIYSCCKAHCLFKCILKKTLDVHMMKEHNAERKHKCRVCGKGFTDAGKLSCHMHIHLNSKNKPFQCEICGNSFAVKNYLYIHMRLSHQNRPFASTHKKKPSRKRKPACSKSTAANASTPSPLLTSSLDQAVTDQPLPSS